MRGKLFFCAALAATAGAAALAQVPFTEPTRLPPVGPHVYIDAVNSDEERAQLERLILEAHAILNSETFRTNLTNLGTTYPSIFINPAVPNGTVARVLAFLDLTEPNTRRIRMPVALVGRESVEGNLNYTASTGSTGATGFELPSSMTIGRLNMWRYRQADVVHRSCAINTMAHEMTHTISSSPTNYTYAFLDTGAGSSTTATKPVASSLVGAVAQCTYLQANRRIQAADVPACVRVFGARTFDNNRCDDFAGGQPIQ